MQSILMGGILLGVSTLTNQRVRIATHRRLDDFPWSFRGSHVRRTFAGCHLGTFGMRREPRSRGARSPIDLPVV